MADSNASDRARSERPSRRIPQHRAGLLETTSVRDVSRWADCRVDQRARHLVPRADTSHASDASLTTVRRFETGPRGVVVRRKRVRHPRWCHDGEPRRVDVTRAADGSRHRERALHHFVGGCQADSKIVGRIHQAARQHKHRDRPAGPRAAQDRRPATWPTGKTSLPA